MEGLDHLNATELRLGLPGSCADDSKQRVNKRALVDPISNNSGREVEPMAKVQVVGWPPVRSERKNKADGIYVKVSMDGAPYLRKIDLRVYKGYNEMRGALEDIFKCFSSGDFSGLGKEGNNGSDHAITYEDKDGDWMLVGDVPWSMFIFSCKRLRIMRGPEARSGFRPMTKMS